MMDLLADLWATHRRLLVGCGAAAAGGAAVLLLSRRSPIVTFPAQPSSPPPGQAPQGWQQVASFDNTTIYKDPGGQVLTWTGRLSVDADGSPRAYHPQSGKGLDYLGNAGKAGNWWGIATDTGHHDGTPIVQGPSDPAPGYYVSTTALGDPKYKSGDPRRYVDSEKIPYLSVPPEVISLGVKLGDLAAVEYGGKVVFAIVADVGPHSKIGEGSIALANALGFNGDPKSHQTRTGLRTYVFVGSGQKRPLPVEEINALAQPLYGRLSGVAIVGWGAFDLIGAEAPGGR